MYVVAGATGHTGKIATRSLLEQRQPVRALVHDAAKAGELRHLGAEVASLELEDSAALARALAGASAAYLLLPPRVTSTQVLEDQARVTESIARAVEKSGVPHVVFLSSFGAQLPSGTGPIRSLGEAERRLRATGAAVTSIRAGYFMENWLGALGPVEGGVLPSFLRADRRVPMVATRDIGLTAARALAEGGQGFQVIELAGPRDYTPADVAAAASTIVGKPVALQVAPEDAVVPTFVGFGMSEDMAQLYREMIAAINAGTIRQEVGGRLVRGATPIEDVLRPALGR